MYHDKKVNKAARMVHSKLTQHTRKRAQQRGIKEDCLPLIIAYGEKEYDGKGGIRYLMTQRGVDRLAKVFGRTPAVQELRGVYVVLSADEMTVLTASYRH